MTDRVSIIIPGRCEPYFQKTVDSVLVSATGDIEVIAIVDGPGQDPPVVAKDPRVKVINLDKSIGQRAAYNLGVKESTGKYVMKIDAHALLSPGFDMELKAYCPDNAVILPEMRRLNVHTWTHKPGKTHFMFFGLDLYCHYWKDFNRRTEAQDEYPEVMTGQGSCWFTSRAWNDYIGLLDEGVGSWGNVGIEISLRTWLCGGLQLVNKKCWQAHWFRKDEGGFTYPMDGRQVAKAHRYTYNNYYFKDDAFKNQCRPFMWLIKKFAPVPSWEAYLTDGYQAPRVIVYYTSSRRDEIMPQLANAVRKQLAKVAGPIPIISVSQKPLDFGKNICLGDRPVSNKGIYETLIEGVRAAPESSIVYLCEDDIFYHASHFAKLPDDENTLYFNTNRYYYSQGNESFSRGRGKRALSQCVGLRETILRHAEERLAVAGPDIEETWQELERRSAIKYATFESDRPNVDILHGDNLTLKGRAKKDYLAGKTPGVYNLPGWGSPSYFESKVGYQPQRSAVEFVLNKFKRCLPQMAPIRIPKYTRNDMTKLFKDLGYKTGVEIGVQEGRFSENLCKRIPGLNLYCVDLWAAYEKYNAAKSDIYYAAAQERLAKYNTTLIRKASMDAVGDFKNESLDFVYIDANHSYDFVMQDLIEWARKVRPGGMVSGHDYYRTRNMGVVPAVDSYTYAHNIHQWFITDEKEATFFWVKG